MPKTENESFLSKLTNLAMDSMKSGAKTAIIQTKDTTNAALFKAAINPFIKQYGQIISIKIDSTNKAMSLEVMLKGELQPLKIELYEYGFIEEGNHFYLEVKKVGANRYWVDVLVDKYLTKKRFSLPREFSKPIRALM